LPIFPTYGVVVPFRLFEDLKIVHCCCSDFSALVDNKSSGLAIGLSNHGGGGLLFHISHIHTVAIHVHRGVGGPGGPPPPPPPHEKNGLDPHPPSPQNVDPFPIQGGVSHLASWGDHKQGGSTCLQVQVTAFERQMPVNPTRPLGHGPRRFSCVINVVKGIKNVKVFPTISTFLGNCALKMQ
jgi:hypothetical protein